MANLKPHHFEPGGVQSGGSAKAGGRCIRVVVVVAAALIVVHAVYPRAFAASEANTAEKKAAPVAAVDSRERAFTGKLPANVADMRSSILTAVETGAIAELKTAIEWNEIKPDFGDGANDDPIAYWKRTSVDGEGREILAVLANMLALPPARLAIGKDAENNTVYVWPYLAELPLDQLRPSEEVDLLRLMPADAVKAMRAKKKWAWWRLAIGADGTWHTFRKYE